MVNLEDNEHDGKMSNKARKRIEKCIAWIIYGAKVKHVTDHETGKRFSFKINFITLTLPAIQVHSDSDITNKCLGNMFDVMKKRAGLNNYIWRAEAQANGNIHFHIITDTFMHYNDLRKWWNQSLDILGYIDAFQLKWRHRNPNSIDVHSVKHVSRLSSYLSKYMAKEKSFACIGELRLIDGKQVEVLYGSKIYRAENAGKKTGKVIGHVLGGRIRQITSRLWMPSRELGKKANLKVAADEEVFQAIDEMIWHSNKHTYRGEFVTSHYGDFSHVIDWLTEYSHN